MLLSKQISRAQPGQHLLDQVRHGNRKAGSYTPLKDLVSHAAYFITA